MMLLCILNKVFTVVATNLKFSLFAPPPPQIMLTGETVPLSPP